MQSAALLTTITYLSKVKNALFFSVCMCVGGCVYLHHESCTEVREQFVEFVLSVRVA